MDYYNFFLDYANISPLSLITLFLLILMRIGPIVHQAAFFGAKVAPVIVRVGLALCLSAVFLPLVMVQTPYELQFGYAFVGYALKELLVGVVLGFFATIPFLIVESTGILIDFLRGSSILQAQDPTTQIQASPIGILYNYVLIYVFYEINGPFLFIDALLTSYHSLPVDGIIHAGYFHDTLPFWKLGINLLNRIMALSIQFSAPSLVAILMAEMFLGIANRLAPQVQIAFLGMSIKSLLGILLLCVSWVFVLKTMGKYSLDWVEEINGMLHSLMYYTSSPHTTVQ